MRSPSRTRRPTASSSPRTTLAPHSFWYTTLSAAHTLNSPRLTLYDGRAWRRGLALTKRRLMDLCLPPRKMDTPWFQPQDEHIDLQKSDLIWSNLKWKRPKEYWGNVAEKKKIITLQDSRILEVKLQTILLSFLLKIYKLFQENILTPNHPSRPQLYDCFNLEDIQLKCTTCFLKLDFVVIYCN